jgi:crotonobetainyl-CoA:carnitine CoA-transferase CaiB-like acyl-CoA transferase
VHRARTGQGTQVDVSLYGSQVALQAWEIDTESMLGERSGKAGPGHPLITPRGVWRAFETADGHVVLGGVNTPRFRGLCELMGLPQLADQYPDDASRAAGIDAIMEALSARFREEPTDYWLPRFARHDIIGAKVQSYADILHDPQARANGYITMLDHPVYGAIDVVGSAIQFGGEATVPQGGPPELGDHTERYLEELGYAWEEIDALRAAEVI